MSLVPQQQFNQAPAGEISNAETTPVVQATSQYGVLADVSSRAGPSGTATEVGSLYECTSGVNANGFGAISTTEILPHRASQGIKDEFSANFSAPVIGNEGFAGFANSSAAFGFGYNPTDAEFGILFRRGGVIEIQELTITVAASGAEVATVTIAGTGYPVNLTAGTVQHNANEISDQLNVTAGLELWDFVANNDQVVADSVLAAPFVGAFSFSSTGTAVAAWVQIAAGVLPTDIWTAQADWSEDNLSGMSPALDPSKFNSYIVRGSAGLIRFYVKSWETGEYIEVHVLNVLNTGDTPASLNPSLGHTWYALNRGATTSMTVNGSYTGLYREGKDVIVGTGFPIQNTVIGIGLVDVPIISIRCRNTIDDVQNLARAILQGLEVVTDSTKAVVVSLYFNPVLTDPVWQYSNKTTSIIEIDMSATALTGFSIPRTGLEKVSFTGLDQLVDPGEVITIAARITSGAASEFTLTGGGIEDL